MADEKSWVEKYIAKVQKSLKARTGSESMQEKHAKKKKDKKKKDKKKKNKMKGETDTPGISNTVKYN